MIAERSRERQELEAALSGVEGWLWPHEAWRLHEAAREIAAGRRGTVVEIGSMKGRSTIALAKGLAARGGEGRVFAIDPQEDESFGEFAANLDRAGVSQLVEPIRATSKDAALETDLEAIDVLFIDGSHEYEAVLQDVVEWTPRLDEGGIVGFNDPFWPGVSRALLEKVAQSGSPFRDPTFFDNTLFFRYQPRADAEETGGWLAGRLRLFLRLGSAWHRYLGLVSSKTRLPYALRWILLRPPLALVRRVLPLLLFHGARQAP